MSMNFVGRGRGRVNLHKNKNKSVPHQTHRPHLPQLRENDGKSYKADPVAFRNCTRMLGELFYKGRLENDGRCSFLAVSLAENLQILVENAHPHDLQLLSTQLFMNGFGLRDECPEQFTKLLNDARNVLISKELTKESKLWLLLCIDGANHSFGLFSVDLYKFYQNQIGEDATAIIQRTHSMLSIRTHQSSKLLDSYQSKINVLKVCSPDDFSTESSSNTSRGYTSSFASSADNRSSSQKSRKPCMPNVGVESRINIETEISSTRREGRSLWDGKPKGGWKDQSIVNDVNILKISSTDNSSQLSTSNTSTGESSGFVSDSYSQRSSASYESSFINSRKPRKPILSVKAMLRRLNINTDASSACDVTSFRSETIASQELHVHI